MEKSKFNCALIFRWVAIFMSLYHLGTCIFGIPASQLHRALHLMLACVLTFGGFNFKGKKSDGRCRLTDWILIAATVFSMGYIVVENKVLENRLAFVTPFTTVQLVAVIMLVVLVLEATRRLTGLTLPIACLIFLAYAFWGDRFTGVLGHAPLSAKRILEQISITSEGIFGSSLGISATYVVIFIILAGFLETTGAGQFFIDIASSATGTKRGGPAKIAVVGSCLFGSISGSSVANVVSTGTFTIPLSKSVGYPSYFAGAVEAVASTGGQIMPPIMGAAAFLMAEMVGVPYAKIIVRAILPAFLYFLGIFLGVHFKAKKLGLKGLPREELPKWKLLLPQIYLILPLVVLVYMIMIGFTMATAAVYATLYCVVVAMISREEGKKKLVMAIPLIPLLFMTLMSRSFEPGTFMGEKGSTLCLAIAFVLLVINYAISKPNVKSLPTIIDAFENGGKNCLSVGIACGMAGIIAGVVTMTGLGQVLIGAIVGLSNGHLIIALVLTMLCCIVLGMGVPTTANYCIMATTCAPILVQMGIPTVAAHFFVFYFGIVADITPPVALAAYAGSAIAKSNPMKTGINATKLAIAAFIVPYIFAYSPALLFENITGWWQVVQIGISALLGIFAIAASLNGFLYKKVHPVLRIVLAIGGLGMMIPGTLTDVVGLVLVLAVIFYQRVSAKKGNGPVVAA